MGYDTVSLKPSVKKRLISEKLCPTETWSHLINRILDERKQYRELAQEINQAGIGKGRFNEQPD